MTRHLTAAAAILALGCSGPPRLVHPRPCPPQGLANERVPVTLALPRREKAFIPPMPVSPHVRGNHSTIRLVIDTLGYVMRDSVTVCGITDPMYSQRLAEEAAYLRFRPGLMNARHVVAPTYIIHDF